MVKCALLVVLVTASTVVASAETVPQGTTLHCRLAETLSTRVSLHKVIASPPRSRSPSL